MFRLENEKDPPDQFEVFFRGWQIAAYYRKVMGLSHPLTRRASQMFFLASTILAQQPRYYVEMSDEAQQFVDDAFGHDRFAALAIVARSAYWNDLSQVDKLAADGDCDTARNLMQEFRQRASLSPEEFNAQFARAPTILDLKDELVRQKCDGKAAEK